MGWRYERRNHLCQILDCTGGSGGGDDSGRHGGSLALNLAVTEAYDAGAALCNDMAAIIASQTSRRRTSARRRRTGADGADRRMAGRERTGAVLQ